MTVLVDPPLWPAHGRLWSHVISDTSIEELHAFARRVGLPARSFEGDHYDAPEERYAELLAGGAQPVGATQLARILRDSGLRFPKRRGEHPLARVPDGLSSATAAPHVLDVVASPHERHTAGAAVVLVRVQEVGAGPLMAMVRNATRAGWAPPGGKRDHGESVREGAVREVAEETGLRLDPGALRPVGYERITVPDGVDARPFANGVNHLQVYAAVVTRAQPLRPDLDDVLEAGWFSRAQAEELSGPQPWWPLVHWWWERH
jgi:8-oxo-dGTP pyrophosphatase MutT (NUDIX family)